jgi:aspartyl-tRNA(Asn)/glutamyl-tRNA(Gln) amidotransferase subunit C
MSSPASQPERLSSDDVRHISSLCRIGLTDEEVERMRDELTGLLNEVGVVQAVDTSGIEPTGHTVEADSVMRSDEPAESLSVNQVMANVPRREGDYIRVRAVLEQ